MFFEPTAFCSTNIELEAGNILAVVSFAETTVFLLASEALMQGKM